MATKKKSEKKLNPWRITKITKGAVSNISDLLQIGIGVNCAGILYAYKVDSWNLYKDGKYFGGGRTVDGKPAQGLEQRDYVVNEEGKDSSTSFVDSAAAAEFFIQECRRLEIP